MNWRKAKESNPRDVGARHGFQDRFAAMALPSSVEPDAGLEPAWPVYKTGALAC
jgi:hypothetical protein